MLLANNDVIRALHEVAKNTLLLQSLLKAVNRIVFGGRHCGMWSYRYAPGST
jgi:hypothetical protein